MKFDKNIKLENQKWIFNDYKVVNNFNKHVKKSIPLYQETHDLIVSYSDYFIKNNSTVYDIGCSTGKLLNEINKRNYNLSKLKLIGIDSAKIMINYCKNEYSSKIKFYTKKVEIYNFIKADIFYCIYTLQFIDLKLRKKILKNIYKSLKFNGAFFFFEKVRGLNAFIEDMYIGVYNDFKIKNGLTPEQILNKNISLRGILNPISENENYKLLKISGFKKIEKIFQYNNFVGYLAIKK